MRWTLLPSPTIEAVAELAGETSLAPALARLLLQRGVSTPEATQHFLHPALEDLHDPFLMLGMKVAVERIEQAIAKKENILIYGDYDVDGTVAVVILKTCIEMLGGVADFHVPHRIREGYGMRDDVLERAAAAGVALVISVDTGIRAFEAAKAAKRLELDLIVTDHHLPEKDEGVPEALAVLNPNQPDCGYPNKSLCGAGVALKIAQALLTRAGRERAIPSFVKMAAIATIADAVSLTGENRVIAKLGLEGLQQPAQGGLKALMQVAQLDDLDRRLTATDVGFRLAPRINAAGRMDVACEVVELFTSKDAARHRELAAKLDHLNRQRQEEEHRILAKIIERLDSDPLLQAATCLVIEGEGWHRGVIGITATRVVECTGKPALVVSLDPETGEAHGSGRSIPAFHLLDALESSGVRQLFTRFGGHAFAVGFGLPSERVPELRTALDDYARARLTADDLVPEIRLDSPLELNEISQEFADQLRQLEPFGVGNREPVFFARAAKLMQPPRYMKEIHAKLRVSQNLNGAVKPFDALVWRKAEEIQKEGFVPGDALDLAFTLEENTHPDFGGLQLHVKALRRNVGH